MILQYHRPDTLEDALDLLGRDDPKTYPMGGGTVLNAPIDDKYDVVDLQNLGFREISVSGGYVRLGATTTLQDVVRAAEVQSMEIHSALLEAILLEATYNLRQMGTVAGTLVAANGRSPFAIAMMALDSKIKIVPESEETIGNLLNNPQVALGKKLITRVDFPKKVKLAFNYSARTPKDLPIVGVSVCKWTSGRTRIVVGGFANAPRLVLDAPMVSGVEAAVKNACAHANDQWASAEYRQSAALTLVKRALDEVNQE